VKVSVAETAENIEFTVLERADVSDETLQGMFYTLKDERWAKGYPKDANGQTK